MAITEITKRELSMGAKSIHKKAKEVHFMA